MEDNAELHNLWGEAETHINEDRHGKAIEIYQYILVRYGNVEAVREQATACLEACRAEFHLLLGENEVAENLVRKALQCRPQVPRWHYLLGIVYSRRYDREKAIEEFEIAAGAVPANGDYVHELGRARFNQGDKQGGLVCLHRALDLVGNMERVDICIDLATGYLSIGDVNNARFYAEKAVMIAPWHTMAQTTLKRVRNYRDESDLDVSRN